ncbi:hypothetical protein BN946_scf184721.g1 [Trametes cinnabarina]|uniref:DNA replication ATP-dependent helicase/nuclease DNA2 n=1 Tax=Pycnoporus cinnabarinus TaxID=5643 RepID=A0A060SI96_PYCCI|nr:hypothetical protein BN946_scf184721.g1 [Trametes cinnabarina]
MERFEGHTDVVKEFVWRRGGEGGFYTFREGNILTRKADNCEFQLITWSKDKTLRFWPVDTEVIQADFKKRTCTFGLQGPWGESTSVFLRVTFTFPRDYPQARHPDGIPTVVLERTPLISVNQHAFILGRLRGIRERERPCLEKCLRFLLFGDQLEANTRPDSGSSSEDEAPNKKGDSAVTSLRGDKNLAEPRTSQGVFSANGMLVCFDNAPPRIVRNPLGELSISPSRSIASRPQDAAPPRIFQSPALLSDAVRRLASAAQDGGSESMERKSGEDASNVENVLRIMDNLFTFSAHILRTSSKPRRVSDHSRQTEDIPAQYALLPSRRSSIYTVYIKSAEGVLGVPDTQAAAAYVLKGSLAEVFTVNAGVARSLKRSDHERVFKMLQVLVDRRPDNHVLMAHGVVESLTATLGTKLYEELLLERNIQMLVFVAILLLRTFSLDSDDQPSGRTRISSVSPSPGAPVASRKISLEYFDPRRERQGSPLSPTSNSPTPMHTPGGHAPPMSSPSSSKGSWSSILNTSGMRQLLSGVKASSVTAPEGTRQPEMRRTAIKRETARHSSNSPMAKSSWETSDSPIISGALYSSRRRQTFSQVVAGRPSLSEKKRITFTPSTEVRSSTPTISAELRSQLLCHVLAYAEMLLAWELPDKRSELLKLVESDIQRLSLVSTVANETLYSSPLGVYRPLATRAWLCVVHGVREPFASALFDLPSQYKRLFRYSHQRRATYPFKPDMPPVARSEVEEADFLQSLFIELDSNAPAASSSSPSRRRATAAPPRTPRRAENRVPSPRKASARSDDKAHTSVGPAAHVIEDVDYDVLMEGVEDWDWDDMNSECMSPRKSSPVKPKILVVSVASSTDSRQIVLNDDWTHADVRTGDTVNVIGEWLMPSSPREGCLLSMIVDSKHNLFIHHPDILLTATALSNASQCLRKPLLSQMVRSSSDVTPSLIWGNMLHEVMQTCLSAARWDDKFIDRNISEVAQRGLGELLRIDMGIDQAIIEVKTRAKGIKAFSEKYIAPSPKPDAFLTNTRAARGESSLLAIPHLYDVEEDIWSPTYGLKGKIDASVEAIVHDIDDCSTPFAKAAPQVKTHSSPMPFEIKTGRAVAGMEHRAQTMLYTLLMSERYGAEVPSGLLYYTQSEEVVRVPAARNEIRALFVMRNDMAGYIMRRLRTTALLSGLEDESDEEDAAATIEPFLPPTIDDNRTCGKCYALDTCMLYRKAVEELVDDDSEIADIYHLKTGHLTPDQAAFFKKWEALISLEEKDLVRFRKELWTMTADEREEKGRCFSRMLLDSSYRPQSAIKPVSQKEGKIHRSTYRFLKATSGTASLLSGHMSVGDAVTVSVDPELLALGRGFIIELSPNSVVLGLDHDLDEELIADRLRNRRGMFMDKVLFRIDKDELFGGMARIRDNLAQLFYAGGDSRRLELIVDLAKPRFVGDAHGTETGSTLAQLNEDQCRAVRKVMCAQDYALILGMPGTGKTTVIAAIIKELVKAGKTVLLTSYTHSAVDTILSKLDDADFGILRLGNLDKIHPAIQKHTLAAKPLAKTIEQLEQQVMSPPVVATTCLSIDHPLFSRRTFDYCIVDEASQITLPTCLGPLRFAGKFVLVGDHFQLPPLVKNKAARKGGLEISLFRRLSDAHPEAVVALTHQYRMNSDIMLLSNKLIYSDRLQCGSQAVATRSLSLPNEKFLDFLHTRSTCRASPCWMTRLMSESCKAVFVDTDQIPARDSRVGDLVENKVEAQLVYQITECLLGCGVTQDQIGVISLYRQQLKLLSYLLQDRNGLEILTADRSQGRDKDCIILSMVRSNNDGLIGELVKDWRRMNVLFTRARSKLIIVGSKKTLQSAPLLSEFFDLMDKQGWILALPPDAHRMHDIIAAYAGTPRKRSAGELDEATGEKLSSAEANVDGKAKRSKNVGASEESIMKGRPLLRDVVNAHK